MRRSVSAGNKAGVKWSGNGSREWFKHGEPPLGDVSFTPLLQLLFLSGCFGGVTEPHSISGFRKWTRSVQNKICCLKARHATPAPAADLASVISLANELSVPLLRMGSSGLGLSQCPLAPFGFHPQQRGPS